MCYYIPKLGLKRRDQDTVRQALHQEVQALGDQVGVILPPWQAA